MAEKKIRRKQKSNRKIRRRKFRFKRFFILLIILAMLIYGLFIAYGAFMHKQAENLSQVKVEETTGEEKGLKPEITPQYGGERFKHFNNIMLIGVDDSNTDGTWDKHRYADAIEVLSFDENNKSLRVITVPRNLVIESKDGKDITIGEVYFNEGGNATVNQLANYLEIPITQYIAIDRKALGEIIDSLGGVEFYVGEDMNYEDPTNGTAIHLAHGYQKLDGSQVTQYLSYRSDDLGDSGRMQRQQQFLKLIYKKLISVEGIKTAPKLFKILRNNTDTNMKLVSLGSMTDFINAFRTDKIEVKVLPGKADAKGNWIINIALVKSYMEELFPIPDDKKEEK